MIVFRILRWLLIGVVALVVLVAAGGAGLYFYMRGSVPDTTASFRLEGLQGKVTVYRDEHGIPYIYAGSTDDAYFALGFVHAQDRMFQMDFQRRAGQGRLAEIVGGSAAPIDRLIRTLGLYRRAQASIKHMLPASRRAVEAYTRGVNAWLKNRKALLPPEFFILWYDPEPWTVADSMVWGRLMALQLATNWRSELMRLRLRKILGPDKAKLLFPGYPDDGPTTVPDEALRSLPLAKLWAALPHHMIGTGASNEWVVAGDRSATRKPILANDPHLGLNAPTLWYLAHIQAPGLTVSGVTVPGVPYHIIAHNGRIAWGVTTTYIDTDDLFLEKVDPKNPKNYLTPDGPKPFTVRTETIRVRFGSDQKITIRETRHGPVLNSVLSRGGEPIPIEKGLVLALQTPWLREDDTTADAFYLLNRAQNWNDFRDALRRWKAPMQNVVYADTVGNIGYYAPGRVPIRAQGKGLVPAPGWTGTHEWTGFIPFDKLPQAFNPKQGFLVNANSRSVDDSYPYFLSVGWGDWFRAQRINDMLDVTEKHTADSFARIQGDDLSLAARAITPLIVRSRGKHPQARRARALLRGWDHRMAAGKPEPLLFMAWSREFSRIIIAGHLGKEAKGIPGFGLDQIRKLIRTPAACDLPNTEPKETCRTIAAMALDAAIARMSKAWGEDMAAWRWGDAHNGHMAHRAFTFIPVLRKMFDLKVPAGGGQQTVNKAQISTRHGASFDARTGPGVRAIFTFDDLSQSRFIIATGQSGNPYSDWYDSLMQRWARIEYIRFRPNRQSLEAKNAGVLTLNPPAGSPAPAKPAPAAPAPASPAPRNE